MKRAIAFSVVLAVTAFVCVQCATTKPVTPEARSAGAAAFATVYEVLMHPRCLNCHPAGRVPLQGDDSRPHAQNVQGGDDGKGLFAMRCNACHRDENSAGAHLPPGAPNWHLPSKRMPLVFQGRTPAELARQLADRAQNGGKSRDEMLRHVTEDRLVSWGWEPGEGRTPVPVPRATFVAAMKAWIDGGCPVPE